MLKHYLYHLMLKIRNQNQHHYQAIDYYYHHGHRSRRIVRIVNAQAVISEYRVGGSSHRTRSDPLCRREAKAFRGNSQLFVGRQQGYRIPEKVLHIAAYESIAQKRIFVHGIYTADKEQVVLVGEYETHRRIRGRID